MAESIIILDDDEEDTPQPSSSSTTSSSSSAQRLANHISPLKAQQTAPTHITQSPFASTKKDSHVLQAENQRLFQEFVEFCSAQTQDCPEVLTFLHAKHGKACPDFLCSAEFRNTVGRCLTRAQANRTKTFVYINELCTVLRQHSAKKRLTVTKVQPSTSASASPFASATSASLKADVKSEDKIVADDEQPSTSGLQDDKEGETNAEEAEKDRKKKKASRRQIAYLENLLKVYNDEIRHLQEKELDMDDLAAEDSGYIQEHKLKRKMMKIYDKLCELKSCNALTGRVIEQRIVFNATRYPEINKKIERFINSPEAKQNPPDYTDVLNQVLRANTRHNLCLSRKKLNQIAQDAFRETGSRLQERRHLDLVYNFGSHLTDVYKPAADPALLDQALLRKLRANREVALNSLEEVITKYAVRQEDTEDQRAQRLEKSKLRKGKSEQKEDETKEEDKTKENGEVAEQEEENEEEDDEEDEEDDASSDPDIEEEIQASTQHDGPDDEEDDEDDNEAEQASESTNDQEAGETEMSASVSAEEADQQKEPVTSGLDPASQGRTGGISPLSSEPSPIDCPTQSGSADEPADAKPSPHSSSAMEEEAVDSSNHHAAVTLASTCSAATDAMSLPPSPVTNGGSSPTTRSDARGRKRKREVQETGNSPYVSHTILEKSDIDSMDMSVVVSSSPPRQARSTRADSPSQDLVTSSQSTPPPKKNKVNVATQCDPDEIIVLSDSE